jgi:glycosyltransferase involved in cell wall biosynthesis
MTKPTMVIIGLEALEARPGGLNRYVNAYAVALERAGVEVCVLTIGGEGTPSLNAPLLRRLAFIWRKALAERGRPILDIHFALHGLLPILTARRRTLRVVHFHGPWAAESAVEGASHLSQRVKAAIERIVYRRADLVITLSSAFADEVVGRFGVERSRVVIIGGGVDTNTFHPVDHAGARSRFGLGSGPVLVMVRRLVQRMGHEVLLDALVSLRNRGVNPHVLIVGEGPARPVIANMIASRGLNDTVQLTGGLDEEGLVAAYSAADVSVIPSVALEGFGLVALESLSCATPVIASDVGGIGSLLRELDASLVVPQQRADLLSDAIQHVLLGRGPTPEACRRFALERSWDAVVLQHLKIFVPPTVSVLFLGHGAQLSGGELALLRQLPALSSVEPVVVLGEDGPLVDELVDRGIDVEVLQMTDRLRSTRREVAMLSKLSPRVLFDLFSYLFALRQAVRELKPDVIHTNTLKAALVGGVVGRLTGIPVVWHVRDRIADDYLPSAAVRLVRFASRVLPTGVVANSSATLATIPGGRVRRVIPSPLDPAASAGKRQGGTLTVTMVGRLSPWKGQDLFLQAFALAFPTGEVRAQIVGEALFGEEAYVASLHELAQELEIADRVDFLGFRRDVADLLRGSDIQVVASRIPEPFGNVVLEGMACGSAVIAPNAGGPAEVLTNDVNGVLVEPDDVEALADALRQLAEDPGRRARLASAAQLEVAQYRPERLAARYDDLYAEILGRKAT